MSADRLMEIRRELIERRAALAGHRQTEAARAIARAVARHPHFQAADSIAVYVAVRGEADPAGIAAEARRRGKRVYLPVLCDRNLVFRRWPETDVLQPNTFGIPEPVDTPEITPAELDLVFAPLVAFSGNGQRIGMGGGFYDRTFAFLGDADPAARPRLVGVAYEFQRRESLPSQPWDVPLDGVVTEAGWEEFG